MYIASNTSDHSSTTTTTGSGFVFTTSYERNQIKFNILLIIQLFSFACYLYVFNQFYRKRHLRERSHYHVILLLLIVSFLFITVALPLTEAYLFTSYVFLASETFCSVWIWIHYSLNIVNLYLMAFASIERNWLIFHPRLMIDKSRLIIIHYLPLTISLLVPPIFYFAAIYMYQCEQYYNYTQLLCKWPCYFYNETWTNINLFLNNYTPLFCIPGFCLVIYLRVFIQKRAMKRKFFQWRRDKKLIFELWAMLCLYLFIWMSIQFLSLNYTYWDYNFLIQAQTDYLFLFRYFIHLTYPFIVLITQRHEMLNFHSKQTIRSTLV